jgi:phosphonoacetaldehyde hydrolase
MERFRYSRSYQGPVQAVIFDWAGTTVDHGCLAPALVFVEVFRRRGIQIDMSQAREPMGMHKRDHLRVIAQMPSVVEAWQRVHGAPPDQPAIDAMYAEFIPLQIECIGRYADPIPGVLDVVTALRERDIKIGSNTGYNRAMMDVLVPAAAEAGYAPDCMVCSSDVPVGRPTPWMALENARQLDVYPMSAVVKVDDTAPGIEEGLNAGMWTVAVTETGNEVGLSYEDLQALDPQQRQVRGQAAERRLAQAGAHYVIDGVGDLLPCLVDIQRRLASGESP